MLIFYIQSFLAKIVKILKIKVCNTSGKGVMMKKYLEKVIIIFKKQNPNSFFIAFQKSSKN